MRYAQTLQRNGKYQEAQRWFEQYEAAQVDDQASRQLTGLRNLSRYYRDSLQYKVGELAINSAQSEFGPAFYRGGLAFAVAQPHRALVKHAFNWLEGHPLDLYFSLPQSNSDFLPPQPFPTSINTAYNEGLAVFFENGRKMIFTRNNFLDGKVQTSQEGVTKLKLLYAERVAESGPWLVRDPFPFNSNEYSVGHPALSPDGKTLYFASDMPGGRGAWICT